MSYDLSLVDKEGNTLPMESHEGGTMPVGGYTTTDFNITYNYGFFFYHFLDKKKGLRWLYGKTGKETVQRLQKAVDILGTNRFFEFPPGLELEDMNEENRVYNYWAPTPGNAGAALNNLLEAAKLYPDAIWEGD